MLASSTPRLKPPPPPHQRTTGDKGGTPPGSGDAPYLAKGSLNILPFHELQLASGTTPILLTVQETGSGTVSAEIFGENLIPGHSYVLHPHTCVSVTSFTGAQLELQGLPLCAAMTRANEDFFTQLINLSTTLNKARLAAFHAAPKLRKGPRILLWGPGRRCGKSAVSQVLHQYSLRTGWTPVMVSLDPSGRSCDITRVYQGAGLLSASLADYVDSPDRISEFLDNYQKSPASCKTELLRQWARALLRPDDRSHSDLMTEGRRSHKPLAEPKALALAAIAGLASREAAKDAPSTHRSDGDSPGEDVGSAGPAANVRPAIGVSLCAWERALWPLDAPSPEGQRQDRPDLVATCCGCANVETPAHERAFLRAAELLALTVQEKWFYEVPDSSSAASKMARLCQSSGMIIDTPRCLSFQAMQALADIFQIDKLLFLSALDTLPPEIKSFATRRNIEVLQANGFVIDLPSEHLRTLESYEQHSELLRPTGPVRYPALDILEPQLFLQTCAQEADELPRAIWNPLPCRLLLTSLEMPQHTQVMLTKSIITWLRLSASNQALVGPFTEILSNDDVYEMCVQHAARGSSFVAGAALHVENFSDFTPEQGLWKSLVSSPVCVVGGVAADTSPLMMREGVAASASVNVFIRGDAEASRRLVICVL
eukprot:Gregarina_sp_Poly_1__2160@NODE_1572_length_3818_cov_127_782991_g1039_i0_p1_GENE_NODE_1572_length_3818_cov_127_782991_g1039_i0NODE_1572_length_3818_cov_127_782991_g1039_i0_p1_ORF_typecomplete_len656_score83_10CLP1_N/PF16573_5/8_4e10CLP1_P/PF16575_5/0_0023CLP1_P/PF16575_5/0_043_NODE_1572_length_3818_cov_127_782991_g1039_i06652632